MTTICGCAVTEGALRRRLLAEFLGSAFLAAVVIGSGIAAQRLSPGEAGLELLENAAATAAGLFAIILMFGPVSGGHFNPVVSFADAAFGGLRWRDAAAYLTAQVAGGQRMGPGTSSWSRERAFHCRSFIRAAARWNRQGSQPEEKNGCI